MPTGIFAIARSGMDVEHQRLEVIAQNLANASTTRVATGDAYQPMRLVSGPRASGLKRAAFEDQLLDAGNLMSSDPTAAISNTDPTGSLTGVQSYGVEPANTQPRLVYEPSHPHADSKGFVHYPGIDHAAEMALMVQTLRVYEANTVMFNAAHSMYMRALDLGSKG
jgi:flagellar basal-body rod protein FlgC